MLSCPDTVRNASRPKKSCTKSTWPCGVRGRFPRSSVDTRNSSPAPSASDPVMIGVLTQRKLFWSKNRWIACARVCRTLVVAAITLKNVEGGNALFSWIDNYCRSNPRDLLPIAVMNLIIELRKGTRSLVGYKIDPEYTHTSPDGAITIEQYVNKDTDDWKWQFWVRRKDTFT